MDSYLVHHNEEIFPDSHTFNPDRWLVPNSKELDKFLVSFSTGSRQCLGSKYVKILSVLEDKKKTNCNASSLAWAELYMVFARVFRKFELKLHEHEGTGIQIVEHWLPTIRGEKFHCTLKVREQRK